MKQKCILLVEDDPINALIIKQSLESRDYKVVIKPNGELAIETMQSLHKEIDMILMDIELNANLNGIETAKIILAEHSIPLLFLSSHTEDTIVKKTEEISSYGYVVKGSSSAVLEASIKMAFRLFEANKQIELREIKYRTLFEILPVGVSITDENLNILESNSALEKILKLSLEDIKEKKYLNRKYINASGDKLDTSDLPSRKAYEEKRTVSDAEIGIVINKNEILWTKISASPIPIKSFGVAIVTTDVTKQKLVEKQILQITHLYATLSKLNKDILTVKDQDELFNNICNHTAPNGEFQLAWIGLITENGDVNIVSSSADNTGYTTNLKINIHDPITGSGPTGRAFKTGSIAISNNIEKDSEMTPWKLEAGKRNFQSSVSIPFKKNERVVGTLNLYSGVINFFSEPEELHLLEKIGSNITFALNMLEIESARKIAEKKLLYQAKILNTVRDAVLVTDSNYNFTYWGSGAEELFGWDNSEVLGKSAIEILNTKIVGFTEEEFERQLLEKGNFFGELIQTKKDGTKINIEANIKVALDSKGIITEYMSVSRDITDRKKIEHLLRQRNEEMEGIFQVIPDLFFSVDKSGKILKFLAGTHIDLYDPSLSFLGKQINDVLPPDISHKILKGLEECFRENKSISVAYNMNMPLGYQSYEATFYPVNQERVIVIVKNTTHIKKELEEKLSQEIRFRATFEQAAVGIAHFYPDGKWIRINKKLTDMIGYSEEDLSKMNFQSFTHPEDLKEMQKSFNMLLDGSSDSYTMQLRFIRKNGSILWVNTSTSVVKDANNKLDYLVKIINDISEQKKDEELILENDIKLKTILETILDSLLIINEKGIVQMANKATEKIFGYTVDELIGQNISILMPEPYASQHDSFIQKYLETGKKKIIGIGREVKAKRKSGEFFDCELSVSEWNFKNERFFTGTIKDISDRKKVEEQLKQSQRLDALGKITGGIAHDFNNILGVIQGNAELIERKIPKNEEMLLKKTTNVIQAVQKGAQLTKKLLSFAKKQTFHNEYIDINKVIKDLSELFERVLGKQIKIELKLYSEQLITYADKNELENVFLNLAINARDAIDNYGSLSIETNRIKNSDSTLLINKQIQDWIQINFSDTGKGIAEEILDKIFDPFFTTKPKGKGTGLGLSMAYGVVNQFGGTIEVKTVVDKGTTMTIYLPIIEGEITKDSMPLETSSGTKHYLKNETVLIVDDELMMLEVSSSLLSNLGYQIVTAHNAQQAQEILSNMKIDLLITDIIMPGEMDGLKLADWAQKRNQSLKIIFVSGFSGTGTEITEKVLSKYYHLHKPFRGSELEELVNKALSEI